MSRASPFPYKNQRANANGSTETFQSTSTKPLQFYRGDSRPTTPNSVAPRAHNASPPGGPSRPQRSELRSRQGSEYSNGDRSSISRDEHHYRETGSNSIDGWSAAQYGSRTRNVSPHEETVSQASLNAIASAFRSEGRRNRSKSDAEYQRERRAEMENEKARQRQIRDRAAGKRRARTGDIDAILDQIKDEWEFVIDPDFNNVDLALQLLDESSTGKDINSFRRTKQMLGHALKGSADKHYQPFNNSLSHHASLLSHLSVTQEHLSNVRSSLSESKDSLGSKRADLVQLWSRGQMLEEMVKILDQIEHLKSVPDILETLMSEKRLLQASVLLVQSLKMIKKPDMLEIGAVADLRSYLEGQEATLKEILVDELHSHLYLKSFWCESRWTVYSPNQTCFPNCEFESDSSESQNRSAEPSSPVTPMFKPSRLNRFVNGLTTRPNDPPHDLNDSGPSGQGSVSHHLSASSSSTSLTNVHPAVHPLSSSETRNPEADSFAYMETILESLAVLGKLGSALDIVAQRLPTEIFALIESTLEEVSERAEYGPRASRTTIGEVRSGGLYILSNDGVERLVGSSAGQITSSNLRHAALDSSTVHADQETLKDFFWTTYSKLDAVGQGLRAIYEIANRLSSRRDFKDSSGAKLGALFPISEICMPLQAEIRTLIIDYLTDDEQGHVSGRNPIASINEILREGRANRDRGKPLFRFGDTDTKEMVKVLKSHDEELTRVLKDTMPGLVQNTTENAGQNVLVSVGTDDRLLGAGQHHRLLIKPDAFHVTALFQPTSAYLERVIEVLPSGAEFARSVNSVMDEFVLNVYIPQLEDKVSSLFYLAVNGADAFQPDQISKRLCKEPLIKAVTQLMAIVNTLCVMLRGTPSHQEHYTRLILGLIIQFYQRCSARFHDLIATTTRSQKESEPEVAVTLSARWAQRPELSPCLSELHLTPLTDKAKLYQLCIQETHIELDFLGRNKVKREHLLPAKNLAPLGHLYRSLSWLVTQLHALKINPDEIFSSTTPANMGQQPQQPQFFVPPGQQDMSPKLPLSREMGLRFQALIKTYEQMAELVLDTIRIDVRCRMFHYMYAAMSEGNYSMNCEATEPDSNIVELNADLGRCDDSISETIPPQQKEFVFVGLGQIVDQLLITTARLLRLPSAFGIKKINRNVLALQQGIKSISDASGGELERAKRYYALFFMSPQDMLDSIRAKQEFSFEEYRTMLNFQCGVNPDDGEAGAARATDRNYGMYAIDLHGIELESSD